MVDFLERIVALMDQEKKHYACVDYLSPIVEDEQKGLQVEEFPTLKELADNEASREKICETTTSLIDEIWREKICDWSFRIVDHFNFSRETVSISISFLDRYVSKRRVNKKLFQLASVTTLYLAIKLHEREKFTMSHMLKLSRSGFSVKQMEAMEMSMFAALSWHLHPPTPFSFVRDLVPMLISSHTCASPAVRYNILDIARFLTELSVCEYFFVTMKPSSIALAALLNAMDTVLAPDEENYTYSGTSRFLQFLKESARLDHNDPQVVKCRVKLHQLYSEQVNCTQTSKATSQQQLPKVDRASMSPSPECVVDTELTTLTNKEVLSR